MAQTMFCLSRRQADAWRSLGRRFTVLAEFGGTVVVLLVKE